MEHFFIFGPKIQDTGLLADETREECAVEVKRLVLELTCSDDVDITERGISSDEDSSPSSKWQNTHPLQELLGSTFQSNSSSQHTLLLSHEDVILLELTRYNTEKHALLTDNLLPGGRRNMHPFLTYLN